MAKKKDKSTAFLYIAKQHQTLSTLYINTRKFHVLQYIKFVFIFCILGQRKARRDQLLTSKRMRHGTVEDEEDSITEGLVNTHYFPDYFKDCEA